MHHCHMQLYLNVSYNKLLPSINQLFFIALLSRDTLNWRLPYQVLQNGGDPTSCNVTKGLLCISRPFRRSKRKKTIRRDNVFYCRDYEITVQCCTCSMVNYSTPILTFHIRLSEFPVNKSFRKLDYYAIGHLFV